MDNLRVFKDEDYPTIASWFKKRGLVAPPVSHLPGNGYIVDGVACGFIYMTDSPVAILDCFIANKDASRDDRSNALNWIAVHLSSFAACHGVEIIKCDSKITAIKGRLNMLGFKDTGEYTSFVKEI